MPLFVLLSIILNVNTMTNTLTLKVPDGITESIRAMLEWKPPVWLSKCSNEKFLYIISKIVSLSSGNRKYSRLKMVPVSSVVLRYELGKHYRRYLDWLIEHKFLISDNHYIVGTSEREGKCKCYGIGDKFRNKRLVNFELADAFILRKILNWKKTKLSETVSDPLMGRLYGMMESFSIDIDGVTADMQKLLDDGAISEKQMGIELDKCNKINDKDVESIDLFIVKDEYSRVHTNLTNISKLVRENHLYVGGKKAVGIDIVSSQPALLHSLFQDYINRIDKMSDASKTSTFYIEIPDSRRDIRQKYKNRSNSYDGGPIYNPDDEMALSKLGFSTFSECLSHLRREVADFEGRLGNGIYENFQYHWGYMHGDDVTRNEMKHMWLSYVFGDVNTHKSDVMLKMNQFWDYHFPVINKLLKYFKMGDYKTLAHTLQRKEADLVYNKLCPRVESEYGIHFSTVHDSIIVPENVSESISELFDEILIENNICTSTDS